MAGVRTDVEEFDGPRLERLGRFVLEAEVAAAPAELAHAAALLVSAFVGATPDSATTSSDD